MLKEVNIKMPARKSLEKCIIVIVGWILSANFALAAELSKKDATKILEFMGYENPQVAFVINGIGSIGELPISIPNAAIVVGVAKENNKPSIFVDTFLFDKDVGWFHHEVDHEKKRVRMWTLRGYMEIKLDK